MGSKSRAKTWMGVLRLTRPKSAQMLQDTGASNSRIVSRNDNQGFWAKRRDRTAIAQANTFYFFKKRVHMAQYVFTMNKVGKIVPPKRQILKEEIGRAHV